MAGAKVTAVWIDEAGKLTDKVIDDARRAADEVLLAIADEHDYVSPHNCKGMIGLWDDLNDCYAPPEVVKLMALELQERRRADGKM